MQVGAMASLALDDGIAFRIRFDGGREPPQAQLYFRGPVLSRFDGREWRMADDRPAGGTQQLAPVGRGEPLRIAELASFLRDPVKAFFRQRLHVDFDIDDPASEDQEPFDLDGLQKWSLWNELIVSQAEALNAGQPREDALAATLARIQRRGELAAKAFAGVMVDDLAAPMADMFERYAKGLAEWPHEAPHDELVSHTHSATGLSIDDWLRDLRLNADEERGRVVLEPSDAVKNGKYQRHHLIKHWLVHLVGHLGGQPLTTLIVSKAGNVRFEPLEPDEARAHIDTLLAAWQDGMRRPLPLAIKTAFAWLDGSTSAQSVYEGGYKLTGELESSPYLRRTWPDFETLTRDGEFARLADSLLRPLFTATFVESARTRKAAATAGEQA